MLKDKLLATGMFIDNEYLDRYITLVDTNNSTQKQRYKTQLHHIIPVCVFQLLSDDVDNSDRNLVNLLYKDHVLAHCLLVLCASTPELQAKMFAAILFILGKDSITRDELKGSLDTIDFDAYQKAYETGRTAAYEYNPMFDDIKKEQHDEIMRSDAVRSRISATVKQRIQDGDIFNEEHRSKLSLNAKESVFIHKWDVVKRIKRCDLDKYEAEGWILNGGTGGSCAGFKKLRTPEGKITYIPPECLEEYLSKGYSLDLPRGWKNKRHMDPKELHDKLSRAHKKQSD